MLYLRKSQLNFIKKINIRYAVAFVLLIVLAIIKAVKGGHDFNVYLYASTQLFDGDNIYANNPYNDYLYSPLFALILRPLSILDFKTARIIWGLINVIVAFRLWQIIVNLIDECSSTNNTIQKWLGFGVFVIALDLLNLNFILGQMTLLFFGLPSKAYTK